MNVRSLWNNFLTGGEEKIPETQLFRLRLLNVFSLISIGSFIIFGIMNALSTNAHTGFAELFFAFILLLNIVYVRGSHNVDFAATIGLIIVLTSFELLFVTGGIARTGWLWIFIFPALAFFLKGERRGWHYLGALLLLLFLTALVQYFFHLSFAYSFVEIRQFALAFLTNILLIYFYVQLTEWQSRELAKKTIATETTNRELETEIENRRQTEVALQKQNQFLEQIKTATLNILEDLKKEKELAEAAGLRNEALLESIGEGTIAIDEHSHIITMNHAAEQILNLDARKVIGKNFSQFWNVADEMETTLKIENRPITKALQGKKFSSNKYTYILANGTTIPVSLIVTPVRLEGKIIGVIEVFHDITKERFIDRAKTEFVYLASHQLRTPLTATKWSAELLSSAETGRLNPAQKKLLNNIYRSNERMIELINALLSVSRIDMGTFAIEPVPTDLSASVDTVVKELSPSLRKKKLQLTKDYDVALPKIDVDQQLLHGVLYNLLANAIKYTPDSGRVILRIAKEKKAVVISVADTGYGIPKNQQDKVFTKFFRADNILTKDTEGTGLGLYIVKSIIDTTGCTIRFESEENKGTTFFITIPLSGMKKRQGTKQPTE